MVGIPGVSLDSETKTLIEEFGISSFILFSRNTAEGPEALCRLTRELKDTCRRAGLKGIIAVDQEGGPVRRLLPPLFPDTMSLSDILLCRDPLKAVSSSAEMVGELLGRVGIDMNLAPVLDLCLDAEENLLKGRCFGKDPDQVAALGKAYIDCIQRHNVMAVAKHFPGIGRARIDPHAGLPVIHASEQTLVSELFPFKQAVAAGVAGIMTSHVIYDDIDPSTPATFSHEICHRLLREGLKFNGLLLSDDLEMNGITGYYAIEDAAVRALLAGHDILLVCNNRNNVFSILESLRDAYTLGRIRQERLRASLDRLDVVTDPVFRERGFR